VELSRLLETANMVCDRKGNQPELAVYEGLAWVDYANFTQSRFVKPTSYM